MQKAAEHSAAFVPGAGLEPAHSCERQILSLLRLPISPPGRGCNISAFRLIVVATFPNIFCGNNNPLLATTLPG